MPIQDLTPQLRTRLNRVERIVGLFILAATAMMIGGLAFYLHQTAENRGWFLTKSPYFTYLRSGSGIHVGDKVMMMGFPVGEVTRLLPERPDAPYNVYVEFVVLGNNVGYIWSDSIVVVKSVNLLGNRYLELIKGDFSGKHGKVWETYKFDSHQRITQVFDPKTRDYKAFDSKDSRTFFYLPAEEPTELSEQLDSMIQQAKTAIPHVLALTNYLTRVMSNTADATERLNILMDQAQPLVTNLSLISSHLKDPKGSLGEWLIPTNLNAQILQATETASRTMVAAQGTLTNANAQITELATSLDVTLDQLALITGNLRQQVDRNTNVLGEVSRLIVNTDDMVQGLKRHWLLRSAFRSKAVSTGTNANSSTVAPPRPPQDRRRP